MESSGEFDVLCRYCVQTSA